MAKANSEVVGGGHTGKLSPVENSSGSAPLVIMGGSFDPPHLGHFLLAGDVVEAVGAECLYFLPAGRNPHKAVGPVANGGDRIAMLKAGISEDPRFEVLDLEVRRDGPSYAIETVERLAKGNPDRPLAWVIGSDQWLGLPRWHRIEDFVRKVEFLLLTRPGAESAPPDLPGLRWRAVSGRNLEISSTEIRNRLRSGKPVDFFLPQGVLEYIRRHQLYL